MLEDGGKEGRKPEQREEEGRKGGAKELMEGNGKVGDKLSS